MIPIKLLFVWDKEELPEEWKESIILPNKKLFVCYTYSRTQLYSTQQCNRYTITCLGPKCWHSSDCDLTYRAAIQDVWGVLLGYCGLDGGNEISLFQ